MSFMLAVYLLAMTFLICALIAQIRWSRGLGR